LVLFVHRVVVVATLYEANAVMENWINYLTLVLLSIGLFWLVLSDSRRSIVVAYSVVVIIVFSINVQFWTFGFALSKLITALMAMLILILSPSPSDLQEEMALRTGRLFRAAGLLFFFLMIIFTIDESARFLSLSIDQTLSSLFILVSGFLLIGTAREPFNVIIGLMTMLVGFEIIYGSVEQSLLINGLLAAVFLFIAVIGSYLISSADSTDQQ